MRQEMPAPPPGGPAARTPASQRPLEPESIDSMVIIDRQVDMVTPMCTQLTYEGLLDEIIGIKNGERILSESMRYPSLMDEIQRTSRCRQT